MPTSDQPLVTYEYAARAPKHAEVNFRWAILADGRYLLGKNPPGAVRPLEHDDPFWYVGESAERMRLSDEQLAAVRAAVESAPLRSAHFAPSRAAKDGDIARLTLGKSAGAVTYVVEDRETDAHEQWIGELMRIFLPPGA